ncbi:DUF4424 domain-containing protein [Mesorhizobium sp. BAC0120]|uniref:DUF4424 domain-containing protein n=1 Tax=Mesorhizobium sp. BAC0120 TaxID=3090670 RepID=UPI00298C341B|nr:DUF4424 domain-containing protein [Mesorhizobium sp. BAC0120]MDW6020703.1 DUF4424 domain-containing protein [Mesorhizobium sp. BAC0120]
MLGGVVAACGVLASSTALANDSIAELGTGGIILSQTGAVSMLSENLSISPEKVVVDYVFKNETDKDVDAVVAFPMPDIEGTIYDRPHIPDDQSDNFLGFEVSVDGKDVKPELEQKAIAMGLDVTQLLSDNHVPVNPFVEPVFKALEGLSEDTAQDWIDRGVIFIDEYDDGAGWKKVRTPLWTLKSTYWWKSSFPANKEIEVSHRYKPSVGGTSGLNFFLDGKIDYTSNDYKSTYCIDDAFEKAVLKAAKESKEGYPLLMEQRLDYVLTTGGNWALGTIHDFKLTIDKGDAKNLLSFCGENVKKTGPTTFEMTAKDYYPEKDLKILILRPADWEDGESGVEPAPAGQGGKG